MADVGSKEKGPVEHRGDADRGGDDHGSEASFRSRADVEEYDSESDGAAGLVRRRRHGEASGSEDEDDREDRDERESIEEGAGRPPLYSDEEDDVDIDEDGIGRVGASEFDDEVILVDMAARSKREDDERLMLLGEDDDQGEVEGRGDMGGEADLLVDGQEEGGVGVIPGAGVRRRGTEGDEGEPAQEDDSVEDDEELLHRQGQLKSTVGAVGAEGSQDQASKKDVEPFVVPTSGAFYMHDDRFHENGGGRPSRRNLGGRKLWEAKDDSPWVHDKFEELNLQDEERNRSRSGRGSRGHRGQARGSFGARLPAFRGENAGRGRGRGRGRGKGRGGQWNNEEKPTEFSTASKTHSGGAGDVSAGVERDIMDRQQKSAIVVCADMIADEARKQLVRVPGLSHQAVTIVDPDSTRKSHTATCSDGQQQEGDFDFSKCGSSGGSGRVVGRGERERGRARSPCGIGNMGMGGRAGGVGRARKVAIGRTGTSGSVAGGPPSAPAMSGGRGGVPSEGASAIPQSASAKKPQMSTSSDPGYKSQRHQTMTKTQTLGTSKVQMSSAQLQPQPRSSSAEQSKETQQPSKKAVVSQLNPTVQVFLPQSYRLAQAQAQAHQQAHQRSAIAAPQVRAPQQPARPGGQQSALVASVPTAVTIPYGQSQGGLAVPAMSVAVTPSYPNQAQYAYPNSEVTWVPVITSGGGVAGGYGTPFLPLEPSGAIYFAPPAADSVQVGSGRAGSDLALQPPMRKAVNMHGGALRGVNAVGGTGKSQAGLWKPPPQSQSQIPAGPVGGDDFGHRQSKPRRYSEMNFNS